MAESPDEPVIREMFNAALKDPGGRGQAALPLAFPPGQDPVGLDVQDTAGFRDHSTVDDRATELQRHHVVPVERHDAPMVLVEYDPRWPELYAREAARIRSALGDRVVALEHVGSTSVPGLAAKPIVDLLLVVADSAGEPAYVPALEAVGYTLRIREPEWHEHRMLKGPDTDVNLHVLGRDSPEIARMVGFRDRLRDDPEDRQRYLAAKRALAARSWEFVQDYADAKSEVVEAILSRAGAKPSPPGRG